MADPDPSVEKKPDPDSTIFRTGSDPKLPDSAGSATLVKTRAIGPDMGTGEGGLGGGYDLTINNILTP